MSQPVFPPPCFDFLNSEMLELADGRAVVRFHPTPEMCNPYGTVQGGILAGMLDNTIGPAVVSANPARASATVQMSVFFIAASKPGEPVLCTANVVKHGRTQAVVEARLERESDGLLLVKALATNVFTKDVDPKSINQIKADHNVKE